MGAYRLWRCDNGTFDVVDDDGIEFQNLSVEQIAEIANIGLALGFAYDVDQDATDSSAIGRYRAFFKKLRVRMKHVPVPFVKTPHDMVRILWEVDGCSGSTVCEAWRGQFEIEQLESADYCVLTVEAV